MQDDDEVRVVPDILDLHPGFPPGRAWPKAVVPSSAWRHPRERAEGIDGALWRCPAFSD